MGEKLWSPDIYSSNTRNILSYIKYLGLEIGSSKIWTAAGNAAIRAIDTAGRITPVKLDAELPVVCTQSASFSNETSQDTAERWQVTVESNNGTLTG